MVKIRKLQLRGETNPVLLKELRGRMRGARAFIVLTVYLLLLSLFVSLIYYMITAPMSSTPSLSADMSSVGQALFYTVVLVELFTVAFITPAFTASAITGERERQTYELLRTTLVPARRIVSGKLTSAMTYMFLLILAAIPLQSLAFMFGGVTIQELALALIILLVTALTFGSIGLLFSALMRTTLVATVLSYAIALLTMIGLPALLLITLTLIDPILYSYSPPTLPPVAAAAIFYLFYFLVNLTPLGAAIATEIVLLEGNSVWFFWMDLTPPHRIPVPSGWLIFVPLSLLLCAVLFLLTVLRVRRQEDR
jgi:ABC-2 type transport system permease protein